MPAHGLYPLVKMTFKNMHWNTSLKQWQCWFRLQLRIQRRIRRAFLNTFSNWKQSNSMKGKRNKKTMKRRPRASNGQRYPLPCHTHFGNLKCARQGKGYCWLEMARIFVSANIRRRISENGTIRAPALRRHTIRRHGEYFSLQTICNIFSFQFLFASSFFLPFPPPSFPLFLLLLLLLLLLLYFLLQHLLLDDSCT